MEVIGLLVAALFGISNAAFLPGTEVFTVGGDPGGVGNPGVVVTIADHEDGRVGAWCAWRDWTPCSQTKCGTTGHRTRTRDCACGQPSHGPIDIAYECEGNSKEIETCVNEPCEIIGEWCTWGKWSPCSTLHGNGFRERTRFCNCPAPAAGGDSNCVGASNDLGRCTEGQINVALLGHGIVYGGHQLVRDSIVFDGRSIVIDGTRYDGNHCTHGGYVYNGRYVGGRPIVYGYPVGHGIYDGRNIFGDTVLFDGHSIVIGGVSYDGRHVVHGGIEYDGYLVGNLPVVYGHTLTHRAKRHAFWEPYGYYQYPIYNSLYYDGSNMWIDGYSYAGHHAVHSGYVYDGYYVSGWDVPVVYGYLDGHNIYDGVTCFSDHTFYYDGYNFWHNGASNVGSHYVYNGFAYDGYWMGSYPVIYGYPAIYARKKRSVIPDHTHHAVALVHHNGLRGEWCEWTDWSVCSKTECGTTGHQHRTRQCSCPNPSLGYPYCSGNDEEIKTCVNEPCPIAGAWCEWSAWTDCTETCGPGHRDRTRTCGCPAPAFGGEDCIGLPKDQGQCKITDCGLTGGWCPWTGWSACSVPCGADGIRKRHRHCRCPIPLHPGTLHDCRGLSEDKLDCHNHCVHSPVASVAYRPLIQGHGHGYGLVVPSHLVYDGHHIIIDGTTYEGSSCTHGGYIYDGRIVDGYPLLYGYPVGEGVYDGHRVFSDGIIFDGRDIVIGGHGYGASHVTYGGFVYDGYLVDGLRVVYGHPLAGHGPALHRLHKRQAFHSIGFGRGYNGHVTYGPGHVYPDVVGHGSHSLSRGHTHSFDSTHQTVHHHHDLDTVIDHHKKVVHNVEHLHHVNKDVHHNVLYDHDVNHRHKVLTDVDHTTSVSHEVSHHDLGTVDTGYVNHGHVSHGHVAHGHVSHGHGGYPVQGYPVHH